MTTCPTCNKDEVRLVEESATKNFFVCENTGCSQYNKRFSERTFIGHALNWAPLALAFIFFGGGHDGGGVDGST
jgi:hypothetical protein